jgi:hypothetical protein
MADLLQFDADAIESWGDWDHHPVLDSATTDYIGVNWPWDLGHPPLDIFGIYESEIKTVTTYDDATPDLDTGWVTGSPVASFTDYTGEPGNIETVTVDARYRIGMDLATIYGSNFPTDQEITVKWSEWERDDLGDYVTQTGYTEDFTLTDTTAEFFTSSWIDIAAPATSGYTKGVGGAWVTPPALLITNLEGATRRKHGFYAYTLPESPPVVYATETATGSLPSCGTTDSEDYDGDQQYAAAGTLTDDRTADAIARDYFSGERGKTWPDLPPISRTTAGEDLSFQCAAEGAFKAGDVLLTLTDPVATAAIVAHVDANSTPSGGGLAGSEIYTPHTLGYSLVSGDETIAMRGNSEYLLGTAIAGFETPETGASFPVSVDLIAIDMDTGDETPSTTGATISYSGSGNPQETVDRTTTVTGNNWVWACKFRTTGTAVVAANFIRLYAKTNATIAYT